MTGRRTLRTDSSVSVDRRAFITTLAVAISGPLAGCSGETKRTTPHQGDENTDASHNRGDPDETTRVERKIKQVYDRIEDVPLVEGGEFVYDLEDSVESVDYEEMVEIAKDALAAAEGMDEGDEVSNQTRNYLQRTARIAFLLVDQRSLVHRALLGGMIFRRAFTEGKYERALDAIEGSRQFLERLRANGGRLEKEVAAYQNSDVTMSGLDASSVTSELEVLKEILDWSVPTFEGFEYTATGMVVVQEGNQELQEERYGTAQDRYDLAQKYFTRAETAFDTAHGRGRSLEYLLPIVEDLRCFVPTLGTGYDDLDEAFVELEAGNEERGLEIARETMRRMDEEFSRCT